MESHSTVLIRVALVALAGIFAVQVYWAATRPIGTGEAYLYDRFVRPTTRQVLASELLDREVLYSILEKRSVGLFHVSPLAVRLPALLFGILYLWAVWRLSRGRAIVAVTLSVVPLVWSCFARADGVGAGIALCAVAVLLVGEGKYLNWIGICLGLSIAADLSFAIPAAALALAILAFQRRWDDWCNTVLIPGSVVALILLVLPLSHAHAGSENLRELSPGQTIHLRSALDALRASADSDHVAIAAVPQAEPVANFYRAQHRATNWLHISPDLASEHFDYYLVWAADPLWVESRHLLVVYRDADFVVARRVAAPM